MAAPLYPVIIGEGSNNEDWTGSFVLFEGEAVGWTLAGARVGIDLKNTSNPAADEPILSLWREQSSGDGAYLSIVDAAAREIDIGVPKATMREFFPAGRYGGDLVVQLADGDIIKVADVVWNVADGYSDSDWETA